MEREKLSSAANLYQIFTYSCDETCQEAAILILYGGASWSQNGFF